MAVGPVICRPCAGKVAPSLLLTWLVHWLQCHGFLCGPLPSALCLGPVLADFMAGIAQSDWVRLEQRKTRLMSVSHKPPFCGVGKAVS